MHIIFSLKKISAKYDNQLLDSRVVLNIKINCNDICGQYKNILLLKCSFPQTNIHIKHIKMSIPISTTKFTT